MDLNITKWYVRLFFWSLGIWDKFWHRWDTSYQYKQGTNLCHFARVICVWMPIVLAFHVILGLAIAFVLVVLPVHFLGWGTYFTTMEVLGLIALAVGVVIMVLVVLNRREQKKPRAPRIKKEKKPREPGVWQIIGAWLMAREQKICLIISFHEPSEVTKDA